MKYRPEIEELVAWLSIEENSAVKLAALMGYRSSLTVMKWVTSNHIPDRQREIVLQIIRSETYVTTAENN